MDAYRHCLIRCSLDSGANPVVGVAASVAHEASNEWHGTNGPGELAWDWYNYEKGAECSRRGAGKPGGESCENACMGELVGGNLGGKHGIPQTFPNPLTSGGSH